MKMYVARDFNNHIFLHSERPRLRGEVWDSDNWFILEDSDFPEVTFENSPMEVELKLIER